MLAITVLAYAVVHGGFVQTSQMDSRAKVGQNKLDVQPGQKLGIRELAERCASSKGQNRFGEVKIDRKVIVSNEAGEITVPCKVNLALGGELTLNKVQLRTKHLVITDYKPNGENRVRVENSTISGDGESGFLLRLSDPVDRLGFHHSNFDYPLSFWASVQGTTDGGNEGGGRIDVTASEIRSSDPKSEGIQLIASDVVGVGNFVGLKLNTVEWNPRIAPGDKNTILLADSCHVEQVEGFTGPCDPDNIK